MACTFISLLFFFFKQKTAYEMRISDWSSDVCSSDLGGNEPDRRANDRRHAHRTAALHARSASSLSVVAPAESQSRFMKEKTMYIFRLSLVLGLAGLTAACGQKAEIGRASCRERGCQYV